MKHVLHPAFEGTYKQSRALPVALLLTTTALVSPASLAIAQNLPTAGSVAAGSVAITQPATNRLTVTQSSQTAVVNWQSFSVGAGSSVVIQQPSASSALLNRVTGNTPSSIAGAITANGQVYLVNPNGIAITSSGAVNVGGGFVGSSLGISDADFMAGKRTFTGNGASANVSNEGAITVGSGGYAALIGGTVSNAGQINVPMGKVGLGSGESIALDFSGDGFLQVAVPTAAGDNNALIQNAGSISAEGGNVIISAATARDAARNAVNISGFVQASTIEQRGGMISIGGGEGGKVKVTGKLLANSANGAGGAIKMTGKAIKLKGATVEASGATSGGTINIGGGYQGKGLLQQADKVKIDAATMIRADATQTGRGGDVVVWSTLDTAFAGTISARGGAQYGDGGNAEVSGKAHLSYTGFADLSAPHGAFGTLLLDPYNAIISDGADATSAGFTATGNDSVINATTLQNALSSANVTVLAGAGGTQAGDITVASAIGWSATTTLSLYSGPLGSITVNAPINITGNGGLDLIAVTGVSFGAGGAVNFAGAGSFTGQSLSIMGRPYTLVYSMAQLDAIDGTSAVTGNTLTTYGSGLSGQYALASNLDASGTTYARAVIGDNSTGNSTTQFSGSLTGLGHTITGLTVYAPTLDHVGLIGMKKGTSSSVSDLGLIGGITTGHSFVGALLGENSGGTVANSYATGNVTGTGQETGGLVGRNVNNGSIANSYATGNVNGVSASGGLAGTNINGSSIFFSYATGGVNGASRNGGLVGANISSSSITSSYAAGTVNGTGDSSGGLVGENAGTIQSSSATGVVTGQNQTGGLAGYNSGGSVSSSYSTGLVSGTQYVGGLVGVNANNSTAGIISNTYATGAVTSNGYGNGGLVGYNLGTIEKSYATGKVIGQSLTGGLVGSNSGTISFSYWDQTTTGKIVGIGSDSNNQSPSPLTSTTAFNTLSYTGFNFSTDWFIIGASTRPFLQSEYSTTITNAHQLQLMAMTPTASYTLANNIDMSSSLASVGGQHPGMWSSAGFSPIGKSGTPFTGQLDGAGKTISNLVINAPAMSDVGLIGLMSDASASVSNIGLIGGSITAQNRVGALVGRNVGGTIQNAYATSAVTGDPTGNFTGGLVGNNNGSIDNSHATGPVSGGNATGGLAGINDTGGVISSSYATGDVTATSRVGGLVGTSSGTIQTSNATGAVTGAFRTGGLVGYNWLGTIVGSYANGAVTGSNQYTGGLVGFNDIGGAISNSYATSNVIGAINYTGGLVGGNSGAVQTSNASGSVSGSGDNIGGLVGTNTGSLQTTFATGGVIGSGSYTGGLVGGNYGGGSISGSYATGSTTGTDNSGGLVGFNNVGGTISSSYASGVVTGNASLTGGLIGSNSGSVQSSHAFGAVTGVYRTGGLVGYNFQGVIDTSYATGAVTGSGGYTGGLVGDNTGAIQTSYSQSIVTGASFTGGLVGGNQSGGAITGSYATGAVAGTGPTGGLIGANAGTVNTSNANGAVTGSGAATGGLVGDNSGTVTSGTATGPVNGTTNSGGLVGLNEPSGSISGSSAGGTVKGATSTGGLIGANAGTVNTSNANGAVTGSGAATGGLVGLNAVGGAISGSTATGLVTGSSDSTGGLTGANLGTVQTSSATGAVTGPSNTGGLVGSNSGLVEASSATGDVTGGVNTGGLAGLNDASGAISGSTASGAVNGDTSTGGLVGANAGTISTSRATGPVTGTGVATGGLVGDNSGRISSSNATGAVTGFTYTGGLVGVNLGTIDISTATGAVTGDNSTGSLVGLNQPSGLISSSFGTGVVISRDTPEGAATTIPPAANFTGPDLLCRNGSWVRDWPTAIDRREGRSPLLKRQLLWKKKGLPEATDTDQGPEPLNINFPLDLKSWCRADITIAQYDGGAQETVSE